MGNTNRMRLLRTSGCDLAARSFKEGSKGATARLRASSALFYAGKESKKETSGKEMG